MSYGAFLAAGNGYHYYLQPLRKIHLISDLEAEAKPNGSERAVYIFGGRSKKNFGSQELHRNIAMKQ
jgi:hypothetical protein